MSVLSEITSAIAALKAETENNAITPESLGSILQKMTSLLNKFTLPFDGIIEDATVKNASLSAVAPKIYYIRAQNCFAAYVDGTFYRNWGDAGTLFCGSAYNSSSAFIGFTANSTNYYHDVEGNIYAFINDVFTLVYKGDVKFTSMSFVNQAVKELYLTSSKGVALDTYNFYVDAIIRKYDTRVTCQLAIHGNYGNGIACLALYDDCVTDDGHEPPSLITLVPQIGSGISGYAVIDWSVVIENSRWFDASTMGKAYITYKAFDLVFSPTIYTKMKIDGEI